MAVILADSDDGADLRWLRAANGATPDELDGSAACVARVRRHAHAAPR